MNPQLQAYRGYPQQVGRRPGPINQGQQHAQQQAAQLALQTQQAQQRALAEHQAAARRSRKPNSRDMPDDVEEWVVGNSVQEYKQLRDIEKRLDHTMQRKRLDVQETGFARNVKRQRTIRIWISNTAKNQSWQADSGDMDDNGFDFGSGDQGTYRVRVEGRLLDDDEDEAVNDSDEEDVEMNDLEKKTTKRLSHFFKAITVEFDRSKTTSMDPASQVEWRKQPGSAEFDCIEFERRGDENMNITINMTRDETPERFRLSHALSQALDVDEADRGAVLMGLWDYVKAMGLQEDDERRSVRTDDRLRAIFGEHVHVVPFPKVPDMVMNHLHPLPPIRLAYTVHVDPEYLSNPIATVYDIRVATDDPLQAKVAALVQNPDYHAQLRQIADLDDQLATLIQAVQHSKAKHTFYRAMAKDPTNFTKRWMSSQRRDLEVILGEATRGGGEDGSGPEFARGGKNGVWDTQVVREAVRYMLAKPEVTR